MRSQFVVIALLCGAGLAHADDRATAREHYSKGTKAFDLGHYEDAVREFEAAYQAKDEPTLLYNLAQANRLAGHAPEALRFYRLYLTKIPNARNRPDVEVKIIELQKTVEQQQKSQKALQPDDAIRPGETQPPPPLVTPRETDPKPQVQPPPTAPPVLAPLVDHAPRRKAGIGVGIAGLVLVVGGVAMVGLAVDSANQLSRKYDPGLDSANGMYRALAGTFLGVGVVAATVGFVIYGINRRPQRPSVSLAAPSLRVAF